MNDRSEERGWNMHDLKPSAERPVVDSPALSQISCLSGTTDNKTDDDMSKKSYIKESDPDFVRLCKEGGHKGLLQIDEQSKSSKAVPYERKGGDWYYQEDKSENGAGITQRSSIRDTDSEFVRLSKQGGHEGLLTIDAGSHDNPFINSHGRYIRKEERISPANSLPAGKKAARPNVAPGNPIWLGGSGPEKGFVPGKRFMKKEHIKESPFALSEDWKCTQSRNPDKI